MPFSSYKQTMRSSFLQTRKLFFATVVIIHAIITLTAAVDVSSDDTRLDNIHLSAAALNLATHLFSFISITLIALLDSIDQNSRWSVSQVRFEVAFVAFIALFQFVNAVAYSAFLPRFNCAPADITCKTVGRVVLAGCWVVTFLHILYAAYFTAVAVFAAQRVKKVWITPTKIFAWDPASLPISRPSPPLDILGHGATMIQVDQRIQRETWVNPQHDLSNVSPMLPPVSALPVPPVPPVPPKPRVEDLYPGQTYPGQKLRRGALPDIPSAPYKTEPDFPQDVSSVDFKTLNGRSRPLTMMSETSNYSPVTQPLKLKGHTKNVFSQDTGMARYNYGYVSREPTFRGRGDWMTPGYTYGREYVERALSPQPSLPSSPREGLRGQRHEQPSITSYRPTQDGRYPHFF